MSLEIPAQVAERLQKEQIIWLTSIREDGMPLPTPVWFLWVNQEILIFSRPEALKIKNIKRHNKVALNFNSDAFGGSIAVILGEARVESASIPAEQLTAYIEKYREGIKNIGMTPESMTTQFSSSIRVKPLRIRGEE